MSGAGAYQDLPPANLTGPCLITSCTGSTVNPPNKFCQTSLNTCTAASRNFTDFFNSSNVERCSYTFEVQLAAEYGSCLIQELVGTVGGGGSTWSLFDRVSTVGVEFYGQVVTSPILTVSSTSMTSFEHFFTEGAATETGTAAASGVSLTSAPVATTASSTAETTTSSCASGYLCGSLLSGLSITSGSLAATGTSSATSTKSSAARSGSFSMRMLLGLGAFAIFCTSAG